MAPPQPLTIDPDTTGPRTLTSAIYASLRADILAGRRRPSEKLLIAPIGKRFSVSLAAVREALSRLVADGLVIAEDQRGFRVSPLSLADLHDVTHTRIELECLALRRSIARGDAAWQSELEQAWDALRRTPYTTAEERLVHSEAWSALHGRFHHALVAACDLEWLLRFRATLYEQSERYRLLGRVVATGERDVTAEHRRIFEATLARDSAAAEAELARHFQRTADAITEACSDGDLAGTSRP
jgi:DNA-binding GntR family transcriptional regulator